jgi:hypothetical protein
MNLQRELLAAVEADPALRNEGDLVTFRLSAADIRALSNDDRRRLKDEILGLLWARTLAFMPVFDRMTTVFPAGSVAEGAHFDRLTRGSHASHDRVHPQVLLETDASSDSQIEPILGQIEGQTLQ